MGGSMNYEIHGCIDTGSDVVRVEDSEAEFFSAYTLISGKSEQLQDFNSRYEAENWLKLYDKGQIYSFIDRGKRWQARVITKGDRYGRKDRIKHEGDHILVEFWDMSQFCGVGQFVSRYHLGTILGCEGGLDLNTVVPAWSISNLAIGALNTYLRRFEVKSC